MAPWTAFQHLGDYPFDASTVKANWSTLHAGDQEPLPQNESLLLAWALFHKGEWEAAASAGLNDGSSAGMVLANQATCVYASYLEVGERNRQSLLLQAASRAGAQTIAEPLNASAYYWQAYALARYSQGISVAKALAQGLGVKVKSALETAIRLRPLHADAHIALGTFHADIIDKVGAMIASMTYGAKKETSLRLFQRALELTPESVFARIEYANALVILEGEKRMLEATALYEQAARATARDARERLDVSAARAELTQ